MKIPSALFVHFIFFGLFNRLFSTNPDSVMVESPEDNNAKAVEILIEENEQKECSDSDKSRGRVVNPDRQGKFANLQMEESQQRKSPDLDRPRGPMARPEDNEEKTADIWMLESEQRKNIDSDRSRGPVVRIMRPFVVGSRIIWREVARERLDTIRDYNPFQGAWRRTNQPDMRRTTETSFTNVVSRRIFNGNRRPIPQNNVNGNNNNFDGNSRVFSTSPATFASKESFSVNNNPQYVTKTTKRISPDANLFAGIVNDFAFKFMETVNLESNFVISPLSIFVTLSICYLGSGGRTKAQIEQSLGMNDNAVHGEHLHKGIRDLILLAMDDTSGFQISVANGMFLGKNFTAEGQFEKDIREYYNAELKTLDFGNQQSSLRTINDWVAQNTRNMITDIINSPPNPMTRLILLNAVYFKGLWKMQFPPDLTKDGTFHSLDGTDQEVAMMTLFDETFPYFRSDELRHTFIKLPYQGDLVSMIIALPYDTRGKPMPSIRDRNLCYVLDAMKSTKLDTMSIPRFRLEYRNSLRVPLQQLGITDIFDRNVVNLSNLRKENDVYVSGIMVKAVIDVNEEGTTASASTAVRFVPLSARNTTDFVADHPFAFYIVHEPSGLVLFYGKLYGFDAESNVANYRRNNARGRPRGNENPARG